MPFGFRQCDPRKLIQHCTRFCDTRTLPQRYFFPLAQSATLFSITPVLLELAMIRRFTLVALAAALSSSAVAQAPAGWQMRLDRSTNPSDPDKTPDVKFTQMGPGFHVTSGPAAVLWSAKNTASGTYTLKGTFHLMEPSGHPNYYGLVFGGGNLEGPNQNYLYFLVGQ